MTKFRRTITSWPFLILLFLTTLIIPLSYGLVQLGFVDTIPDQTVAIYLSIYFGINAFTFLLLCFKAIKGFSMSRFVSGLLFLLISLLIFNDEYFDSYDESFFESYMGIVFSLFIALPQLVILLTRLIRLFIPDRNEMLIKPIKTKVSSFTLHIAFLLAGLFLGYLLLKDLLYLNEYDTTLGIFIFLSSIYFVSLVNFKLLIFGVIQAFRRTIQQCQKYSSVREISLVFDFSKPIKPQPPASTQTAQTTIVSKPEKLQEKKTVGKKRFLQYSFIDIENYILKKVGAPEKITTHKYLWLCYAHSIYTMPLFLTLFVAFIFILRRSEYEPEWGLRITLNLLTFATILLHSKISYLAPKMRWFVSILDHYDKQDEEQKNKIQVPGKLLVVYQISKQILISLSVIVLASVMVLIIISSDEPNTSKIQPQTLTYYVYSITGWAATGSFLYLMIMGLSVFIASELIYYYKALLFHKIKTDYEKTHQIILSMYRKD